MLGVAKAYVTRVGEGPFPSEIAGDDQERMRELGGEYGTVTGRERRCGWLDLVALRYAVRVNGIDQLALTKLDVLSHFAELPVCVRYRTPRRQRDARLPRAPERLPRRGAGVRDAARAGASRSTAAPRSPSCRTRPRGYVDFVERELEVEVTLVGTGAERESVLTRAYGGGAARAFSANGPSDCRAAEQLGARRFAPLASSDASHAPAGPTPPSGTSQ